MGAYEAMFGGETVAPSRNENIVAPKKSTMSGFNQQLQPTEEEDQLDALIRGSYERNKLKAKKSGEPVVKQQMQAQLEKAQQPSALQQFGQSAAALGDVTVGGILPLAGHVAQAVARPFTTPQKAEEIGSQISSAVDKPFGKAFGVTETPGYKAEITNRVMNFITENIHKGDEYIAKYLHLPVEDVKNMVDTLGLGIGAKVAPKVSAPLKTAAEKAFSLEEQFAQKMPKARIEPTKVEPTFAPEQPAATQPKQPAAPTERTIQVPEEVPPMPEKPLQANELSAREDVLRRVGIENIRKSALENNPKEATSQFITSQASQEPYGHGMTEQINHEKSALENHFSGIEKESGGHTVRYGTQFQERDKINVGKTVKSALEKGQEDYLKRGHEIYEEAKKNHGDKPVNVSTFSDYLNNKSNFAYSEEQNLQKGIKNYMEAKGLLVDDVVQPMTVADAEGIRKYINAKYKYDTGKLAVDLKSAIDKDVFEQVGGETYEKARKHWGTGKDIYDNPKTVGNLLADEGTNQKIADEKVMTKVLAADDNQFTHLFDTLKKDNQTKAINQIQTSLVEQIRQAGQSAVNQPWNSVAAAKEAANLSSKLQTAFADNPQQLQKIYDGIEAGNIVHIPTKYPGAGVQTHLLKNKFSELALQRGATAVGGSAGAFVGGPLGAAVGAAVGEKGGEMMAQSSRAKRQTKQLEKEIKYGGGKNNLSDIGKGK